MMTAGLEGAQKSPEKDPKHNYVMEKIKGLAPHFFLLPTEIYFSVSFHKYNDVCGERDTS